MEARSGEPIASALYANGIRVFGHHTKDHSPQGLYCANGQCAQCMVVANGRPVKACITPVQPDDRIEPLDALPAVDIQSESTLRKPINAIHIPVLIIGGGPAGASAAIELGKLGVETILIDDKDRLGGKLVLQTHRFFGSKTAVYAGTRGIDIATQMEDRVRQYACIDVWANSTALAVFSDQKVGILKGQRVYCVVEPEVLLVATGAREKFLTFPGNTLPGVLGAGAFQTLLNRDLVRPSENLFIIGGGNVGLIAGYHALQAGIRVLGLAEALPEVSGYKVHRDKLARSGVPIFTSHSIRAAYGKETLESIEIVQVDEQFQPVAATEKSFRCDTLLIAVGLDPVDEFYRKAQSFGMRVFNAGDAKEIAEASAAIYSGKIAGAQIAKALSASAHPIPREWATLEAILKSKPGSITSANEEHGIHGVFPVFHCTQEIPCDPCAHLCPQGLITLRSNDIRSLPQYIPGKESCKACLRCVAGCPGLAITLVDFRKNATHPLVSIPYELSKTGPHSGLFLTATGVSGDRLGSGQVVKATQRKSFDRTHIIQVNLPAEIATKTAGIQIQSVPNSSEAGNAELATTSDDALICRCERVTEDAVRAFIRAGCHDVNEMKTLLRAGMGACGGKTCLSLMQRIFRQEGISLDQVAPNTLRPLFVEVTFGALAGLTGEED